MLVKDVFKVFLYPDSKSILDSDNEGEDITSGILNVDIQYGTSTYEGPQEQIDSGQFTIVTRNPNLDPKINPNLNYNSAIKFFDERSGEFFRGYVTDVQVEYQRKNYPIITITGTDIFGMMQSYLVSKELQDTIMSFSYPGWGGLTFSDFLFYITDFTDKYLNLGITVPASSAGSYGFWFDSSQSFRQNNVNALDYAPAQYIPQVGETYLDVINKYAQTNLTSFSARGIFGYDAVTVYSFPKYNPYLWGPQEDPLVEYTTYDFSSSPDEDRPYETILIENGYNRVISQLDIFNQQTSVVDGVRISESQNLARISEESVEDYLISAASISTVYPLNATQNISLSNWADGYSENIFQVTLYPSQEIQQIRFDNARSEDIENNFSYSDYDLNRIIRIKHEINDTQTIDRVYDICGIRHNISPDKWEMAFTLKPSVKELVFNYQGSNPTLEMNATSGDSNFNFTATITGFDPETITSVVWALSATDSNEIAEIWPYAFYGRMFKNGLRRTGLTQTWNFDDDGILAPYSFSNDGVWPNYNDNRYGGYGTGFYTVYAFIRLSNGFRVVLQKELTVGTPEVQANFGWTQNLTNNFGQVTFVDTSVNHETGEPDSYVWDFGDGTTSTQRNPIKTYDPGPTDTEYDVSLTVFTYGEGGLKIPSTKTETITLAQPTMTADFTWAATYQTVTFTNTSINVGFEEPDAYLWDFGDGTTSTEKNPVKVFPIADVNYPESFTVTLTTKNIWEETSTVTKTVTTTALNKTGNYPVRYIKLRTEPYTRPGTGYAALTPQISRLKARTSNTLENLTFNAKLEDFSDSYLPSLQFVTLSGDSPQTSLGLEGYLTRSSSNTLAMGCGSAVQNIYGDLPTARVELVLWIPDASQHLINDIIMKATTLYRSGGIYDGYHPEDFYPKIYVDVATTVGGYTPNPAGTVGPPTLNGDWLNIGYFKFDGGSVPNTDYTMTALRPLPLNIPYFLYTFDDKTAYFDSVETADSYAWTFGDGTTSTLKNPVKTYATYGTYTVTLAVTNGGIVTRTTTEPVIVEPPVM